MAGKTHVNLPVTRRLQGRPIPIHLGQPREETVLNRHRIGRGHAIERDREGP